MFRPGIRAGVFIWEKFEKISARLPRSRSQKPRSRLPGQPAFSYEHIEIFVKKRAARRDLGNRASLVNRAHMKRPWIDSEIPNHCKRCGLSCNHSSGDLFTCEDNMLFSRVKISCFRAKAHLVFHWCFYNKQNITWPLREISLRVLKNISRVSATNEWNIFQHSKRNLVSPRGHVISSIYFPPPPPPPKKKKKKSGGFSGIMKQTGRQTRSQGIGIDKRGWGVELGVTEKQLHSDHLKPRLPD